MQQFQAVRRRTDQQSFFVNSLTYCLNFFLYYQPGFPFPHQQRRHFSSTLSLGGPIWMESVYL